MCDDRAGAMCSVEVMGPAAVVGRVEGLIHVDVLMICGDLLGPTIWRRRLLARLVGVSKQREGVVSQEDPGSFYLF